MLRKRTSFKPNLKQVSASPQQPQPTNQILAHKSAAESKESGDGTRETEEADKTVASVIDETHSQPQQQPRPPSPINSNKEPETASISTTIQVEQQPKHQQPTKSHDETDHSNITQVPSISTQKQHVSDLSNKRVQEAITQLTGQKFEPIKSLSLRSSANKNVKLKDLLFFNPPMTKDQKRHKKSVFLAKKSEQKKLREIEEQVKVGSSKDTNDDDGDDDDVSTMDSTTTNEPPTQDKEPSLVPKVKMGPEGKLILDESSTIINRKNSIKEQEAIVEDNEDVISKTNYDSFRRRPTNTSQTKWSLEDTKKFYQALTILGTDFSMMESLLFSGLRSRTELHKKFKREERLNKLKVDIALSNRISLNSEELDDLREMFYK